MTVVGLTGSICSGKSTIAKFLAQMGATVISADEIGHEAYQPHCETWQQVVDAFGKSILTAGDEIDRQKLGEIVFKDPEALSGSTGSCIQGCIVSQRRGSKSQNGKGPEWLSWRRLC